MNSAGRRKILAIDVGNSNIKFGVYHDGDWSRRFRISTVGSKTPDEYGLTFASLLAEAGFSFSEIDEAVLGSVVPPLTNGISEMVEQRMGKAPTVIGPGVRTGIRIHTESPTEVGSDIIANAVAAYDRSQGKCIVVAFGTAITFSAVGPEGELLGVAIAPGLRPAAESLVRNTAQLRLVEYVAPPGVLGKNTTHALQAGLIYGFLGLVEGLAGRMRKELGGEPAVFSTGDQARYFLPLTSSLGAFDPWLTLEGLRLIAERNR